MSKFNGKPQTSKQQLNQISLSAPQSNDGKLPNHPITEFQVDIIYAPLVDNF